MNNRIYIAGKVTGDPDYRAKFEAAVEKVAAFPFFDRNGVEAAMHGWLGFEPVNPTAKLTPDTKWRKAMVVCFFMLLRCSYVYMLADWRDSKGATKEHRWAKIMHKRIIYAKR